MQGFLLFYLWWRHPSTTITTIEVPQLHADILWNNVEMQLSAFDFSALAYLGIQ